MNEDTKKFEDWHWEIYQHYLDATVHLNIWCLIHNPRYRGFVNSNKEFFVFDASAHQKAGILAITRLLDPDSKSINLERFLKFCLNKKEDIQSAFLGCKFCNDKINEEIKNKIVNLQGDLGEIKKWRNKAIAHKQKGFRALPIKWEHFQKIINFLEENFLDYGTEPNQRFPKAESSISEIEEIFDKKFQKLTGERK